MGMLARFLDFLFPPADTARVVAETSSEAFGALVAPLLSADGTIVLLPYRHARVRAAIIEAKFHRNAKAFELLGEVLREYLASMAEDSAGFETPPSCIVPIPLGPARRRERGYNQVEEVAKCAEVSVATDILRRVRDTPPQTSLSRARRLTNMEGAFETVGVVDSTVSYILLDDVMTTGATLAIAAEALGRGGARSIIVLALAH